MLDERATVREREAPSPGQDAGADVAAEDQEIRSTGQPRRLADLLSLRKWVQYPLIVGIVAFVLWRTDLRAAWDVLRSIQPGWALAGIAALIVSNVLHGVKWQRLLCGIGRVPVVEAVAVFWASMATNNVLPFRAGDVVRVDVLARRNRLPRAGVFATLLTERVLDAICFFIILLVALGLLTSSSSVFWVVALILGTIVGFSLGATVFAGRLDVTRPIAERPLLRRLPRALHRQADSFLPAFVAGLRPLSYWRSGSEVVLWALGAWALECVAWAFFGYAFGLHVAIANYLLVMIAVNFVSSLTILPANLGVFEVASAGVLNAAGASSGQAAAYAVGSHILVFGTISLVGLATLPYLHVNLRQLEAQRRSAPRSSPPSVPPSVPRTK